MVEKAGLEGTFLGGYLSVQELDWLPRYREGALQEPRLAEEHRSFITELEVGADGLDLARGAIDVGADGLVGLARRAGGRGAAWP